MDPQALSQALSAFLFGGLSAASLSLGAATGILFKPPQRLGAAIMAFGAGALFAALSLELVGEALERLDGGFWPVGLGCLAGGVSFVLLDRAVNSGGGFLRKRSTLSRHLGQEKRGEARRVIAGLGKVPLFASLPPEEIRGLIEQVERLSFPAGTRILTEGEEGRELFVVEEGRLLVEHGGNIIARLGKDQVVGEMALLRGESRSATVTAELDSTLLMVRKADFDRLLAVYPSLKAEVEGLAASRKANLELAATMDPAEWARRAELPGGSAYRATELDLEEAWSEVAEAEAVAARAEEGLPATAEDSHGGGQKHGGAPIAIWLGILIDGIPESAVIGASMVGGAKVSLALILGLFIANFPEAMSSSVGMRKMGMSPLRIQLLWLSIVLVTALGAALGNIAFRDAPVELVALFESLAAGAMLAMLAETMMPEAYEQGGSVTGMSTILGFLAALFIRTVQ
jgi:CRP-like cAMP-binding protein